MISVDKQKYHWDMIGGLPQTEMSLGHLPSHFAQTEGGGGGGGGQGVRTIR